MDDGPTCVVRSAGADDLLGVARLIDRLPGLGEADLTPVQRAAWDRALATPDLTIYVADAAGHMVGTTSLLLLHHVTYGCRPTAFVEAMVVAAEKRRRGIGRMLVERVLQDAGAAGCRKVQLLSHKRHAEDGAHEFYRWLGFTAEAEGFRLYL